MAVPTSVEKLRIVLYPDPVLRKRCSAVTEFDQPLADLAQRMLSLMHEANGVGLAAPQVGVPIRMFVCNHLGDCEQDTVWVNPVLSDLEGVAEAEEGCLSIPGINVPKRRATKAVITACDLDGNSIQTTATDLLARIWQHEADHLDGVLVIDGMSEMVELANRRVVRQLEADFKARHR